MELIDYKKLKIFVPICWNKSIIQDTGDIPMALEVLNKFLKIIKADIQEIFTSKSKSGYSQPVRMLYHDGSRGSINREFIEHYKNMNTYTWTLFPDKKSWWSSALQWNVLSMYYLIAVIMWNNGCDLLCRNEFDKSSVAFKRCYKLMETIKTDIMPRWHVSSRRLYCKETKAEEYFVDCSSGVMFMNTLYALSYLMNVVCIVRLKSYTGYERLYVLNKSRKMIFECCSGVSMWPTTNSGDAKYTVTLFQGLIDDIALSYIDTTLLKEIISKHVSIIAEMDMVPAYTNLLLDIKAKHDQDRSVFIESESLSYMINTMPHLMPSRNDIQTSCDHLTSNETREYIYNTLELMKFDDVENAIKLDEDLFSFDVSSPITQLCKMK